MSQQNLEARSQINNFAVLIRSILNNSRSNAISLADEIKTLNKYLEVEQFCQDHSFEYYISNLTQLDPAEISLPPMLIQPFVENAIVHGIHQLNRPGRIHITFNLTNNILIVKVRDNGRGRTAAATRKQKKGTNDPSIAIEVTRERLINLRGPNKYEPLVFQDLEDKGQPSGTQVVLKIPVQINF